MMEEEREKNNIENKERIEREKERKIKKEESSTRSLQVESVRTSNELLRDQSTVWVREALSVQQLALMWHLAVENVELTKSE